MSPLRNLLSLTAVEKGYGSRSVLSGVSLGVAAGERIGVVGRNGDGKSTLLRLLAGVEEPDAGTLTRTRGLTIALLDQRDEPAAGASVRDVLLGGRAEHEWAADSAFREVLGGLLGGVSVPLLARGLETPVQGLSGGERRRVALARLLLDAPELLLLDEPTNHLDVEGVDWLAAHLARRRGSILVVTHDRWFLDAVCTATWEVSDGAVHRYEGGYAAYVLARAERERVQASREERRRGLMRKELAWLRRGPPARTTKPRFRIDAANALIADEPPVRDRAELLRFATSRLGDRVLDAVEVTVSLGGRTVLDRLTWRLGPGDRVAVVGANGSGKTSLIRVLAGELALGAGALETGSTVRVAHLSQDTVEVPGALRVLEALEEVRGHAVLSDGREIDAGMLCERFGFGGSRSRTPVAELSGGERRRLALMRLLVAGPNVLLLDEPTNDLDIETLTALEDLLDGWPGTLVIVSHDRYFIERVCEDVYALDGGALRHLPGGVEQYLSDRRDLQPTGRPTGQLRRVPEDDAAPPPGARILAARREARRLERALRDLERSVERLTELEASLQERMAAGAGDHAELARLHAELERTAAEREAEEAAWLELSASLEDG